MRSIASWGAGEMNTGNGARPRALGDQTPAGVSTLERDTEATVGHLDVVFHDLDFESLCTLRDALHTLLRDVLHAALVDDTPSVADVADIVAIYSAGTAQWVRSREEDEPTDVVMMLLSAIAVAVAWWTHRDMPPPVESIRAVVMNIDNGDAYLLPIPSGEPCFCDSGVRFKACHGRPPPPDPS
jgi:hypothetical protein